MNQIDYGPMLAASSQSPLTPAMQNMALMTALFRDVAMPMMQMGLQREQMALQQSNELAKFEIARGQMEVDRARIQVGKEVELAKIEVQKERMVHEVQLEDIRLANGRELVMLADEKAVALEKLSHENRLDLYGRDRDLQEARLLAEASIARTKIEAEKANALLLAEAEADNAVLTAGTQTMQLRAAALLRGDLNGAANLEESKLYQAATAVLARRTGTAMTPQGTIQAISTWFTPERKADTFGDPRKGILAWNALAGATPQDRKQYELNRVMPQLAASLEQPVGFLSDINIPILKTTQGAEGAGFELLSEVPSGIEGKNIPVKGSTTMNLIRLAKQPEYRPLLESIEKQALAKAPESEKASVRSYFRNIRNGPADFSDWLNGGSQQSVPALPANSVLAAPPGAAEEAQSIGYLWRGIGGLAKGVVYGASAVSSLLQSPEIAMGNASVIWDDEPFLGKGTNAKLKRPAPDMKAELRKAYDAAFSEAISSGMSEENARRAAGRHPETIRLWKIAGQPKDW